jgi:hypothetical protein
LRLKWAVCSGFNQTAHRLIVKEFAFCLDFFSEMEIDGLARKMNAPTKFIATFCGCSQPWARLGYDGWASAAGGVRLFHLAISRFARRVLNQSSLDGLPVMRSEKPNKTKL